MSAYPYVWRLRKTLPERTGQPCRVTARGRGPGPRNIRVEFLDGFWVIAQYERVSLRRRWL